MDHEIFHETEISSQRFKKAKRNLGLLAAVFPRDFHFPSSIEKVKIKNVVKPSERLFHHLYIKVDEQREKAKQAEQTVAEHKFLKLFEALTQKQILPSVWIGDHCTDLFVPNVRSDGSNGRVMRGLVFEVDGDVHNYESKMKKDNWKSSILHMLGIGQASIPNWDFNQPTTRAIHEGLKNMRPLDSRERRRLWRRIILFTLALEYSEAQFLSLFQIGVGRE